MAFFSRDKPFSSGYQSRNKSNSPTVSSIFYLRRHHVCNNKHRKTCANYIKLYLIVTLLHRRTDQKPKDNRNCCPHPPEPYFFSLLTPFPDLVAPPGPAGFNVTTKKGGPLQRERLRCADIPLCDTGKNYQVESCKYSNSYICGNQSSTIYNLLACTTHSFKQFAACIIYNIIY